VSIGWYFGHTHTDAKRGRELLKEYESMRALGTDADLIEAGTHFKENIAAMDRTDEFAAAFAMRAVVNLEEGNVERAKKTLAGGVRFYCHRYSNYGGDSNLISRIEQVAQTSPYLANAIAKIPE
jgi:hypothetical protein